MFGLQRLPLGTTPPTEPVSTDELKAHLRLNTSAEDTLLAGWIVAARMFLEAELHVSLVPSLWQLTLDRWPRYHRQDAWFPVTNVGAIIILPRGPVTRVAEVSYIGQDGLQHTLPSAYVLDAATNRLAILAPAPALSTQAIPAVLVQYEAGYAVGDVPAPLIQAILVMAGDYYTKREASSEVKFNEIPYGVKALIHGYMSGRTSEIGLE